MTEPRTPEDLVQQVRELQAKGRFAEVIARLDEGPESIELLSVKAEALQALGEIDEALACFDQMIDLEPKQASPLAAKADFLMNLNRYADAIECYDRAVEFAPDEVSALQHRALALRLAGDTKQALSAYTQIIEIEETQEAWAGKADLLVYLGSHKEAISCLEKASAQPGFDSFGWTSLGYSLERAGAIKEAIFCYDRAIDADPKDELPVLGKASALSASRDIDGALACYDRAIEIRPDNARAWFDKGIALSTANRPEEALACYQGAIEREAPNHLSWLNSGYCQEILERYDEAQRSYSRALEINPTDAASLEGMGRCLNSLGRPRAAERAYRRALEIDPKLLWSNNNLGVVLSGPLDRPEEAIAYFDRVIEIDTGEALGYFNKAETLEKLERWDEAEVVLKGALKVARDRDTILLGLAAHFSGLRNEEKKALEYFEEIHQEGSSSDGNRLSIAELLIRLGRHDEARKQVSEVLKTSKDGELNCVAGFLQLASHALEGNSAAAGRYFTSFIETVHLTHKASDSNDADPVVSRWSYQAFARAIAEGPADMGAKFMLLVAIDLQQRRLASPSLDLLTLPLAKLKPPNPEPDAGTGIFSEALGWFQGLLTKH